MGRPASPPQSAVFLDSRWDAIFCAHSARLVRDFGAALAAGHLRIRCNNERGKCTVHLWIGVILQYSDYSFGGLPKAFFACWLKEIAHCAFWTLQCDGRGAVLQPLVFLASSWIFHGPLARLRPFGGGLVHLPHRPFTSSCGQRLVFLTETRGCLRASWVRPMAAVFQRTQRTRRAAAEK